MSMRDFNYLLPITTTTLPIPLLVELMCLYIAASWQCVFGNNSSVSQKTVVAMVFVIQHPPHPPNILFFLSKGQIFSPLSDNTSQSKYIMTSWKKYCPTFNAAFTIFIFYYFFLYSPYFLLFLTFFHQSFLSCLLSCMFFLSFSPIFLS